MFLKSLEIINGDNEKTLREYILAVYELYEQANQPNLHVWITIRMYVNA